MNFKETAQEDPSKEVIEPEREPNIKRMICVRCQIRL